MESALASARVARGVPARGTVAVKHICLRGLPWYFPCVSRSAGTLILTGKKARECNRQHRGIVLHVKHRDKMWRAYNGNEDEDRAARSTRGIPPTPAGQEGASKKRARFGPAQKASIWPATPHPPPPPLRHRGGGLSPGGPIPTPPPPSLLLMEVVAVGDRGGGASCVVVTRPPWRRYGGGWSGGGGCMGVQYRGA